MLYKKDFFYPYNAIPVLLIIGYIAIFHLQKKDFFYCGILAMLLSWSYASGLFILLPITSYFLGVLITEKRIAWLDASKIMLPVFC